jgi:hypothetical protein
MAGEANANRRLPEQGSYKGMADTNTCASNRWTRRICPRHRHNACQKDGSEKDN